LLVHFALLDPLHVLLLLPALLGAHEAVGGVFVQLPLALRFHLRLLVLLLAMCQAGLALLQPLQRMDAARLRGGCCGVGWRRRLWA